MNASPRVWFGLRKPIRLVAILIGGIVLLWLALGVTVTLTKGRRSPELALRLWPWGVEPKLAVASRSLRDGTASADRAHAETLAGEALAREPVSAEAARTLALIKASGGDQAGASQLMRYSEAQSRRDLPTQLWLIEEAVGRNDIQGALVHYDRALRTSRRAADALFPTLVVAADDIEVARPLGRILARRPVWWSPFMFQLVSQSNNPAALDLLARSVKLDPAQRSEFRIASGILSSMVKAKSFDRALNFYNSLSKDSHSKDVLVRNGNFEGDQTLLPFDWWLRDDPNLSALREADPANDNTRLAISASGGLGGQVARQMLVLSPGRYRLTGTVGNVGPDRNGLPSIVLQCDGGRDIARYLFPPAGASGAHFEHDVTVPPGCPAQWLGIQMAPAVDASGWIDSIGFQAIH